MCENKAIYYVPHGYDYREVEVKCGLTDPHGGRAVCDECAADRSKMEEIRKKEEVIAADNWAAASAGWGEY